MRLVSSAMMRHGQVTGDRVADLLVDPPDYPKTFRPTPLAEAAPTRQAVVARVWAKLRGPRDDLSVIYDLASVVRVTVNSAERVQTS